MIISAATVVGQVSTVSLRLRYFERDLIARSSRGEGRNTIDAGTVNLIQGVASLLGRIHAKAAPLIIESNLDSALAAIRSAARLV
jgi:hypothetical protein